MVLYFPHVLYFNRKPSVNDDITQGVIIGQPWAFENEERYFINVNNAEGAARWIEVPDLYRLKQFFELHADFIADYTFGTYPLKVCFTDISTGPGMVFDGTSALEYLWDFGDGNTSTEKSPCHIYQELGPYTITLIITNPITSDTIIKQDYIGLSNAVGDHAYAMGGQTSSSSTAIIDKITFPMNGLSVAKSIGNLTTPRMRISSCNSSIAGYCMAGYNTDTYNYISNIDKLIFPFNNGLSSHISNLVGNKVSESACNSSQYGYCMTDYRGSSIILSYIDRLSFSNDSGNAIHIGQLINPVIGSAGCNSSQHGYTCGGTLNLNNTTNIIQRIKFPFNSGQSTRIGNLSVNKFFGCSCNSSQQGYVISGYQETSVIFTQLNTIDKFNFPFDDGTTISFSTIQQSKTEASACNSSDYGYVVAGITDSITSNVERFNFPFDSGIAEDAGWLSESRHSLTMCDETDFNTIFNTIVNFSATPTTAYIGTPIQFTDNSQTKNDVINSFEWDFGDGNSSMNRHPSHTYYVSDNYDVSLTVTTQKGIVETVTKSNFINISLTSNGVGNYGYTLGGCAYDLSNTVSFINRIVFPFDSGFASLVGNLSDNRQVSSACNSTTHGYAMGGVKELSFKSVIDRITFSFSSGTASPINTLSGSPATYTRSIGINNETYGFYGFTSSINRFLFPFDSGIVHFCGYVEQHNGSGFDSSCNSSTKGYCFSEKSHTNTRYSSICRFKFPFESGSGIIISNLSSTKNNTSSCNSSMNSYTMGGCVEMSSGDLLSIISISTIDRLDFASEGNAQHFSNLSGTRNVSAGINSSSHGYSMGGLNNPNSHGLGFHSDIIDRFDFPFNAGVATHVGDLLTIQQREMGCDETDFNTLFNFYANFYAIPTSAAANQPITFVSTSPGNIDSYSWDFNNNGQEDATGQTTTHSYNSSGLYSVALTVNGPSGTDSIVKTNYISIDVQPTANFTCNNTSPIINQEINFIDQSVGSINSWSWDFGDGGSSVLQNPVHIYTEDGFYTITLTVSGPVGSDSEIKTNFITVSNVNVPIANFVFVPINPNIGETIIFTNTSIGDIDSWAWDFDDGSSIVTTEHATHSYSSEGAYNPTLTVSGPGGEDTISANQIVNGGLIVGSLVANFREENDDQDHSSNIPVQFENLSTGIITKYIWNFGESIVPIANFTVDDTTPSINQTVEFINQTVNIADSFEWNFGDGNTSTEDNPSHVYTTSGAHTVYLIATNSGGSTIEIKEDYINVSVDLIADFSVAGLTTIDVGSTVNFIDNSTSAGTINSWIWDFGDGGSSVLQNPSHTYSSSGIFNVSLTVGDEFGDASITKTAFIIVNDDFIIYPTLEEVFEAHITDFDADSWILPSGWTASKIYSGTGLKITHNLNTSIIRWNGINILEGPDPFIYESFSRTVDIINSNEINFKNIDVGDEFKLRLIVDSTVGTVHDILSKCRITITSWSNNQFLSPYGWVVEKTSSGNGLRITHNRNKEIKDWTSDMFTANALNNLVIIDNNICEFPITNNIGDSFTIYLYFIN